MPGKKKVTITVLGAGGFIGSHLIEHLLEREEYHVIGIDLSDDKLAGIGGGGFSFRRADLRKEPRLLEEVICAADVVVDLVAYANPSLYITSPLEVFELNFTLNLDVANLCVSHGKRLIQYSSAEVYGKANGHGYLHEDETDLLIGPINKQRWIYSAGKALLERVIHAHGLAGDLDYTIIRPFNFIGSRLDYLVPAGSTGGPRVFPHFMSALLSGGPMYLVDGGEAHRAFLHISDANRAFQCVLDDADRARNEIYNIGNPDNDISIRGLAVMMLDLYEELTGRRSQCELVDVTGEEFYGEGYEDANRLPPSIEKMCALGWAPRYDLRSTFRDAMRYYLARAEVAPPQHAGPVVPLAAR